MIKNQEESGRQIAWTGNDILFIILITLSATIIFGSLLNFILSHLAQNLPEILLYKPILINFLQFITMLLVSGYIILSKYNLSLKVLGLKITALKKIITSGLIGGVIICLMVLLVNLGLQRVIEKWLRIIIPAQPIVAKLTHTQNKLVFLAYSCLIVIIAPLTEEIFFRGLLYQYCKKRWGLIKGAGLAAVIFGIAHFNLWAFLATFLGGLGLIILYELSQSLYTSIIAHATWNLIIVTIIYLT